MTFGEKLQDLRQRRGLSQDALAERLGVSRQAVSRWERDETMPETEKVVALADLFGVTTDELLRDRPRPEPQPAESRERRKSHDLLDRLGRLARTRWYLLGWLLVAWGAVDLLQLGMALSALWGLGGQVIGGTVMPQLPGLYEALGEGTGAMVRMLLVVFGGYAAIKIAGGLLVVFLGRRYVRRRREEQ